MTLDPEHDISEEWEKIFRDGDEFRSLRRIFRHIPSNPRCELCNAPFGGLGGFVLRNTKGIKPSALNPRFCNDCERLAEETPGGAVTQVVMLIADIRGSTAMAEGMNPREYSTIVERFYNSAGNVLIDKGALIERLIGDEVAAIFPRGLTGDDYVQRAIEAAEQLLDTGEHQLPIGIGVHSGEAFVGIVGEVGRLTTFSALGDTVNITARLASAAGPGEVVVSQFSCDEAAYQCDSLEARSLTLKGKSEPVPARIITSSTIARR